MMEVMLTVTFVCLHKVLFHAVKLATCFIIVLVILLKEDDYDEISNGNSFQCSIIRISLCNPLSQKGAVDIGHPPLLNMHGHGISYISSIGIDNGMLIIITIGSAAEITLGSVNDTLSRDDAILDHSGLYILGEIQANGNATEFCGYGKVNTDVFSARS